MTEKPPTLEKYEAAIRIKRDTAVHLFKRHGLDTLQAAALWDELFKKFSLSPNFVNKVIEEIWAAEVKK